MFTFNDTYFIVVMVTDVFFFVSFYEKSIDSITTSFNLSEIMMNE